MSDKISAQEAARREAQRQQSYRENEDARWKGQQTQSSENARRRILSYRDLRDKKGIPFSRQWLRKLIAAGKFPASIQIGEASVGFVEDEVDEWIANCIRQRDSKSVEQLEA